MNRILAIVLHAPSGASPLERYTEGGQRANASDLVALLDELGDTTSVIVSAERCQWAGAASHADHVMHSDARPFHFGAVLKDLIRTRKPAGLLYFGSGAGALLSLRHVRRLASFADTAECGGLFNNFYSCDFAAIAHPHDLLTLELPEIDNGLGFAMADAGLPCYALPRSAVTQCDIDTPLDLLLLRHAANTGDELRTYLGHCNVEHPRIDALLPHLRNRAAVVTIVGRANPATWSHFEQDVACRTSGLIEGRGMRASRTRHLPMLSSCLRQEGARTFFRRLSEAADAAVIDSRALLAGRDELPPKSDRFASDLFRLEEIEDPLWRSFSAEAAAARIPVLLGGHSLVSGGLYLLAEACWKGSELPRRLHPDPYPWEDSRR